MMMAHTKEPWLRQGRTVYSLMHAGWHKGVEQVKNRFWATVYHDRSCSEEESAQTLSLIATAPDLLAEIERQYIELADYRNEWPGRSTMAGQAKLIRMRDLIAKATGRSERDVQDDYGTRAARDAAQSTGSQA